MVVNKKHLVAFTTAYAFIFISAAVLTSLANDVFSVPYLTPLAHFLKAIVLPFLPLIMPLYIGAAIKLYKHDPFPSRRPWLIQSACIILQQSPRVWGDLASLYDWSLFGNGMGLMGMGLEVEGLCGLGECTGSWVEAALMAGVVVGESVGWKWDAGYVQKLVNVLAADSTKTELEKEGEAAAEIMEKGGVVESEVVGGASDGKTPPYELLNENLMDGT